MSFTTFTEIDDTINVEKEVNPYQNFIDESLLPPPPPPNNNVTPQGDLFDVSDDELSQGGLFDEFEPPPRPHLTHEELVARRQARIREIQSRLNPGREIVFIDDYEWRFADEREDEFSDFVPHRDTPEELADAIINALVLVGIVPEEEAERARRQAIQTILQNRA